MHPPTPIVIVYPYPYDCSCIRGDLFIQSYSSEMPVCSSQCNSPVPLGHTGLEHSTDTTPQRSSHFGPQHSASVRVQHGAEMGLQHLGIKQSNDQESSIGNSSLPPMGCSPNNTGGSSQPIPHIAEGDVSESIPLQEWPLFPEYEQPSPTTPQSVSQADQGGAMVQVEGVAGLSSKHLEVAFDNEDEGGGKIDDIALNGDIAIITFQDVNGEGMLPFCSSHGVHVQSLFILRMYIFCSCCTSGIQSCLEGNGKNCTSLSLSAKVRSTGGHPGSSYQ